MNVKKLSIGAAVVTVLAGITVGICFMAKPAKGSEAEENIYTEEDTVEVPKEEWESLGLLKNFPDDPSTIVSIVRKPDGSYNITTMKDIG